MVQQLRVSKRNIVWLAVIVVVGVVAGSAFGWKACLAAVAVTVVISEVFERRVRSRNRTD